MGQHPIDQSLDEYRIISLLAEGGVEKLYIALDVTHQRYAAVKVIDVPFRVDAQNAERLRREAQGAAALQHPHIVTLYRFGQKAGRLYAAMEFVEGATLEYVLRSLEADGEHMPLDEVVRIVGEVGQALDYAHGEGVIHGDVRPGNILVDRKGHCYVSDFGLTTLVQLGTAQPIGPSPYYLAQERALSATDTGPQSDLYALGVLLFQMITDTLPSETESRSVREIRPEITEQIEVVVDRAIAKSPAERFQSGAEMAAALEEVLEAAPISTSGTPETVTLLQRVARGAEKRALPVSPPTALPPVEIGDGVPRRRGQIRAPFIIVAGVLLGLCVAAAALFGLVKLVNWWHSENASQQTADGIVWPFARSTDESVVTQITLPSSSPSPTESALPAADTPTAEPTPTEETTVSPTMPATETPTEAPPTSTLVPPSPTVQVRVVNYSLVVAVKEGAGVFVVNQGPESFPLPPLALDNGSVVGTEWGVSQLSPGECAVVWSDSRDVPVPPDGITCSQVGEVVVLVGRERLWRTTFTITYDGVQVGTCGRDQTVCPISFTVTG